MSRSAVTFAVLTRLWQIVSGVVTQFLIILYFSPVEQGYYQTFNPLLNLQNFFELGLSGVLLTAFGHYLRPPLSDSSDSHSRLALAGSLFRQAIAMAVLLGVIYSVTVFTAGFLLMSNADHSIEVAWLGPWIFVVLMAGITLSSLPPLVALEAVGDVSLVYSRRFWAGIAGTLLTWVALWGHAQLWIAAVGAAVRVVAESSLILERWNVRFATIWHAHGERFPWKEKIWPLQLRAIIQGFLVCLSTVPLIPALMRFQGPEIAGRAGVTISLLYILQSAAAAWVQTRIGDMTALARDHRYSDLQPLFRNRLGRAMLFLAVIDLLFIAGIGSLSLLANPETPKYSLGWLADRIAHRILLWPETTVFAAALWLNLLMAMNMMFVRVHLYDPFVRMSVVGYPLAGLALVGGAWWGGAMMAGIGFLLVQFLVFVPWSYLLRRECETRFRS